MANRSTFESSLPREFKRMLSYLGTKTDQHHVGTIKRMMIEAHANHRRFKNKRFQSAPAGDENDEA